MVWCCHHVGKWLERIILGAVGAVSACAAEPAMLCAGSAWLSFEAYDLLFGRDCALGVIIVLFCHELGHIAAARIIGVRSSMPYFVPLVGAVICLRRRVRCARDEAFIALGGPALGSISACIFLVLYLWSDERMYLLWAYLAAWLNLFNLVPCYPLDGSRAAETVSRHAWCVGILVMAVCLIVWKQILFLVLMAGGIWRWYRHDGHTMLMPCRTRLAILGCYLLLCLLLSSLTMMIEAIVTR